MMEFLQKRSRFQILLLGTAVILVTGLLDYWTGSELSFSIFYLVPVAMITWHVDGRAGFIASAACAVIWLLADLSAGQVYSSSAIPYWNALVRFGIFSIVTYTMNSLRSTQVRQEELSQFVVHDLRSPLANIVAGLTLVLDTAEGKMAAEDNELLRLAVASCNRMMALVNSLLDLAKLESGRMQLNRQESVVTDLFDAAVAQTSALALRSQVDVTSEVEPGANSVLADSELIMRVLINLLSNALKYSAANSSVRLQAVSGKGQMVEIRVVDTGPGIPKEWASRVFDKFAQVEARNVGMAVGSGLGLSFCQLAVQAHGGRIWIETEVGQGSTVIFTLPRP